jgi:hypothetical protein
MKDLHTLIYVNLKRIYSVGLLYTNLELVPTLSGTIIFYVKIVFAYHAKLVK